MDCFVGWHAVEEFLYRYLGRRRDALGKILYLALKMFKVILLRSLYNFSDRKMDNDFIFLYDSPLNILHPRISQSVDLEMILLKLD